MGLARGPGSPRSLIPENFFKRFTVYWYLVFLLLFSCVEGRDYGQVKDLISDTSRWRQDSKWECMSKTCWKWQKTKERAMHMVTRLNPKSTPHLTQREFLARPVSRNVLVVCRAHFLLSFFCFPIMMFTLTQLTEWCYFSNVW